ncbi:Protein TTN-1 c [Aphelenchoides avenae]|nr:Protein TTN-1 c [Aphelenchus avenae]
MASARPWVGLEVCLAGVSAFLFRSKRVAIVFGLALDLPKSEQTYELIYEDGVSVLRFRKVAEEDEGEYVCEAYNIHGQATTKCFARVTETSGQDDQIAEEGDRSGSMPRLNDNFILRKIKRLHKDDRASPQEKRDSQLSSISASQLSDPESDKWYYLRPGDPKAPVQATESFIIHKYFDAEYITHSFSIPSDYESAAMHTSLYDSALLGPMDRLDQVPTPVVDQEVREIMEHPVIEIERVSQATVQERIRIKVSDATPSDPNPGLVQPVRLRKTQSQPAKKTGDDDKSPDVSLVESYIESLFNLENLLPVRTQDRRGLDRVQAATMPRQGAKQRISVRRNPSPRKLSEPYLLRENSMCQAARVVEITQEWALQRDPDEGIADAFFSPLLLQSVMNLSSGGGSNRLSLLTASQLTVSSAVQRRTERVQPVQKANRESQTTPGVYQNHHVYQEQRAPSYLNGTYQAEHRTQVQSLHTQQRSQYDEQEPQMIQSDILTEANEMREKARLLAEAIERRERGQHGSMSVEHEKEEIPPPPPPHRVPLGQNGLVKQPAPAQTVRGLAEATPTTYQSNGHDHAEPQVVPISDDDFRMLRQTVKEVQRDLDEAQFYRRNMTQEARDIERAIMDISERIAEQEPVSKAQAEANAEILKCRLAEMILNLPSDQSAGESYKVLQKPVQLLEKQLKDIEKLFIEEEEKSVKEELKQIARLTPVEQKDDKVRKKQLQLEHRSHNVARMTPLVTVVRHKLEALGDAVLSVVCSHIDTILETLYGWSRESPSNLANTNVDLKKEQEDERVQTFVIEHRLDPNTSGFVYAKAPRARASLRTPTSELSATFHGSPPRVVELPATAPNTSSKTHMDVSVNLRRRGAHQHATFALPIRSVNMHMSQYMCGDEQSVQMLCEESDVGTDTDSAFMRGTARTFLHTLDVPMADDVSDTTSFMSDDPSIPILKVSYDPSDHVIPADPHTRTAKKEDKLKLAPSSARSSLPLPKVEQEDDESSYSENIPILFRKMSSNSSPPDMRETAILSDEDDSSLMQVYNIRNNFSETFTLKATRRHYRVQAVVYPELRAEIGATFLGDDFQVDIERMSQRGRDSVLMLTGEFCRSQAYISGGGGGLNDWDEEGSEEDEPTFQEDYVRLTVSVNAKSQKDDILVHLEEIIWDDVQASVPPSSVIPPAMTGSMESRGSVPFNVIVSQKHNDQVSSSHASSQRSLSQSEREMFSQSQQTLDIPTYVIRLGSTASITCELNNFVERNVPIEWYRGRTHIHMRPGKYDRISHDLLEVLIISNVEREDGDLYNIKFNGELFPVAYLIAEEGGLEGPEGELEAVNGKARANGTAPPAFLTPPQTMFAMEGQTAILSCQRAEPHLNVMWYREQEPLEENSRIRFETTDSGWYRAIIEDVSATDKGTYYACLEDCSTSVTLVVEEHINEKEVQVSDANTDDEELSDYLVPPGSTATIACELESTEHGRELRWQRNGRNLEVNNNDKLEHVINGKKHYLIIHNADPSDSGVYSVSINNTRFKVAQITISEGPQSLQGSRVKKISNTSINS